MSKKTKLVFSGIVIGAIAAICGIVYFVNKNDSIGNFEDDFEDNFEDEFEY